MLEHDGDAGGGGECLGLGERAVASFRRALGHGGDDVAQRSGPAERVALAELDPEFSRSQILVADTVDGKPLFGYQGPFRIVSPRDTRGARSIRMLQRLDVVRLAKAP